MRSTGRTSGRKPKRSFGKKSGTAYRLRYSCISVYTGRRPLKKAFADKKQVCVFGTQKLRYSLRLNGKLAFCSRWSQKGEVKKVMGLRQKEAYAKERKGIGFNR
jgi:hypothetical protein